MFDEALESAANASQLRLKSLRDAFDNSFAEPPAAVQRTTLDLLSLRLGGDRFAIRLSEAAGLFAGRPVTRVPSAMRELKGIAGLRGAFVPVYDLAALVGYPPVASARWLILAREREVAFAVEALDPPIRVDLETVITHHDAEREHVHAVVSRPQGAIPIVHLASVIAALIRQAALAVQRKEP